ncbi:ferredoxin [Nocardiopsis deserti]|uniref:ferredoxin n=1 Tax=Nocardiopsis deserti TaxID=2605988 RepID=UPI001239F68D|nr:ferredoxin [Nocardiopsis deserti]
MKVRVDADRCMAHGLCMALASEVFEVNDESGYNEMGEFEVGAEQRAHVLRGVSGCPEKAISVLDEG